MANKADEAQAESDPDEEDLSKSTNKSDGNIVKLPLLDVTNSAEQDEYVEEDTTAVTTVVDPSIDLITPSQSNDEQPVEINFEESPMDSVKKVPTAVKMGWGAVNPYSESFTERTAALEAYKMKQDRLQQQQPCTSKQPDANVDIGDLCLEDDDKLGGSICVFYTNSPFSDFAPFPFIVDGRYYYTLEHYFQIQMLYAFGLFKLASECIRIPDAVAFRSALKRGLRELIKDEQFEESTFTKWKANNTFRVLRRGNKAKFEQNYQLRQILMQTEERLLVFANSKDRLLGVGMTEAEFLVWSQKNQISLEDLIEIWCGRVRRPKDLGQNILGLTLMEVRAEIIRKPSVIAEWKHTHKDLGLPPLIKRFESLTEDDRQKMERIQTIIAGNAQHPGQLTPLPVKPKPQETLIKGNGREVATQPLADPTDTVFARGRWCDERSPSPIRESTRRPDRPRSPTAASRSRLYDQHLNNETVDDGSKTASTKSTEDDEKSANAKDEIGAIKADHEKKTEHETAAEDPESIDTTELQTTGDDDDGGSTDPAAPEKTEEQIREDRRLHAQRLAERSKNVGAPVPETWKQRPSTSEPSEETYHPDSVLGRLKKLTRGERVMINPHAVVTEATLPYENETEKDRQARWEQEQAQGNGLLSVREPEYIRPPGSVYHLEPGEICPPGVIAPPPGVDDPAILLPVRMRPGTEFVTELQEYDCNPAALPVGLLPIPLMPSDWTAHPHVWRQRFAGAPRKLPSHDSPLHIAKYPIWAERPRVIEAPSEDPDVRKKIWQPSKNPVADALATTRQYMERVKRMVLQNRSARTEEGATPTWFAKRRKRRYSGSDATTEAESESGIIDLTDDDSLLAAYLAERSRNQPSWLQLRLMGFEPPPIQGNPRAQARNVKIKTSSGAIRFVSREAALRHAANRWCRQGKLGSTGKYQEMPDEFQEGGPEDDDEPVDYSLSLADPYDGALYPPRPKRPVETHIIYLDTSKYEPYVQWYQRNHGFVPLPYNDEYRHNLQLRAFYQSYRANVDMQMYEPTDAELFFGENESVKGVEQLFGGKAWGEYWALSRWKWAQWERRIDRGEQAHVIDLAQKVEVKDEGASYTGMPMKYEVVDIEEEGGDVQRVEAQPMNRVNLDDPIVVAHTNPEADAIADLIFARLEAPKTEVIIE